MRADNKLFFLVLVAAALSLIALKVNFFPDAGSDFLTGFATEGNTTSGILNLSVQSGLVINFTLDTIDWGTGRVDIGANNATLDTSRNTTQTKVLNGNWTGNYGNRSRGLILENIGNVNATLYVKTGLNATQFIGGSNPLYQFNVSNNETGSCWQNNNTGNMTTIGLYYDVNITGDGSKVCDHFSYSDSNDALRIDILLRIPSSSNTGSLSDSITATAYLAS